MFTEDLTEFLDETELADAGIFAHGDIVTIDSDLITDFYMQNSNDYVDDNYIEANSFKVVGIQPDGTGLTSLLLETQI